MHTGIGKPEQMSAIILNSLISGNKLFKQNIE